MAQIGSVKLSTDGGNIVVPIFELGDSGSNVKEFWRINTSSGVGFLPLADPAEASFPYIRIKTQNYGVLALHNDYILSVTAESSLVARYGFEQNINDSTGDYDATSITGITYPTGSKVESYSAYFDGAAYADLPFTETTSHSICFWFKTSTQQPQYGGRILSNITSNTEGTAFGMGGSYHGDGQLLWHSGSGSGTRSLTTSNSYRDGNWHHAVFTYSDTNGPTIYVDGVEKVSSSQSNYDNTSTGFEVGKNPKDSNKYYTGYLDDLRYYNKVLSSSEVSEIYNRSI